MMEVSEAKQEYQFLKDALAEYIKELSKIVKEKCIELDEYQKNLPNGDFTDYFQYSYEMPYSIFGEEPTSHLVAREKDEKDKINADSSYQRFDIDNKISLNENCYKEIFFLLNRILNNDPSYDHYIRSFSSTLLSEFNLFIIQSYFETVKKELEGLIKYTYQSPKKLLLPKDIFQKINRLCDNYGIEYVFAATEAIKSLLDKRDIGIGESSIDNQDLSELFAGEFRVLKGNDSFVYVTKISGIGRTIYEVEKYLLEKAKEKGIDIKKESSLITKLRNVGSHGEFEYATEKIVLKNNEEIVISPSGNKYFTLEELNSISRNIIEKMSKNNKVKPDLFSPGTGLLHEILSNPNSYHKLEGIDNEFFKLELINLLISLSLFSIIGLNSENFFKYMKDYEPTTFMSEIRTSLPINKTTIDETTNQKVECDTTLGETSDKEELLRDFEIIKNAIGHNNVYISYLYIICTNDYTRFKRMFINRNDSYSNSEDYIKQSNYAQIAFSILDWIKYIADDSFFKMISMSALDQEISIIRAK